MSILPDQQLKLLAQQEPINHLQAKHLAQMHQLDIMYLILDLQLKPLAQQEPTSQALVRPLA